MIKRPFAAPRRLKPLSAVVAVVAAAGLCVTAAPAQAASYSVATDVQTLVNRARASAGCSPIRLNVGLINAAQQHSTEMARYNYFSHTGRGGTDAGDRISKSGYPMRMWGENIAAGQTGPQSVMSAWMKSPGHRANILNCRYTSMGLAYARGGNYGVTWTQVFAAG